MDSMGMVTERVWRIKLKTSYEGRAPLLRGFNIIHGIGIC